MSLSKEMNKFVALHVKQLRRVLLLLVFVWYVSGLYAVDHVDPLLFVAIWVPLPLILGMFCYKW